MYPDIISNEVRYIHGDGDYLCAATVSGINQYNLTTDSGIAQTYIDRLDKCFQMANGEYYYTIVPPFAIQGLDDTVFAWSYGREVELSDPIPEDDYQYPCKPDNTSARAGKAAIRSPSTRRGRRGHRGDCRIPATQSAG